MSQKASYWSVPQQVQNSQNKEESHLPKAYSLSYLNDDLISLIRAKKDGQKSSISIELPLPNGALESFSISLNQVMPAELRLKYPNIGSYSGVQANNPDRRIYLEVSHKGLTGMIIGGGPTVFLDPISTTRSGQYMSYFKEDAIRSETSWTCSVGEQVTPGGIKENKDDEPNTSDIELKRFPKAAMVTKEYELAVAVTAEYTAIFGGTVADGLAAVVTAINRVSGVYEAELGIRLKLVGDNDKIIYTDSSTDPFSNGYSDLNLVQDCIDQQIGNTNYDVGHIFTSSDGGVAGLGVVCNDSNKSRGLTGQSDPIGDPFYIDYVAHEIGHQFGANHTFNGVNGACYGGNRNGATAYEPGSGTSIMAYAGICGNDNVQINSEPYFHLKNLMEITNLITGDASGCATDIAQGNSLPFADANISSIDGKTIPMATPFELEGAGTDADADEITYQWNQWDLGPKLALSEGDNGSSPILRSFNPTTQPKRTFPQHSDLINNTITKGEILPTTDRDLNFQLVVRDNQGGWAHDDVLLHVTTAAGPFLITSQNNPTTLSGNTTITWDVAGTDANGVNCSDVDILLSIDEGMSFPYVIANGIANNGMATVTIPNVSSTLGRIKVKCSDNVFFDINDVNLIIEPNFDCNTTEMIRDNPIVNGVHSARAVLSGSGTVPPSSHVIFTGGQSITLYEEFTVESSAVFEVFISDCN